MLYEVRVLSKHTGLSPVNTYEFKNVKECIEYSRNFKLCSEFHYRETGSEYWSIVYFDGPPPLLPLYRDMLDGSCCFHCIEPHFESDKRTIKTYGVPTLCVPCNDAYEASKHILETITPGVINATKYIPETERHKCFYCNEPFSDANYRERRFKTRDHIKPLSKGGKGIGYNLVYCCSRCNNFKGDMMVTEFLKVVNEKRQAATDTKHIVYLWRIEYALNKLIKLYPHLC